MVSNDTIVNKEAKKIASKMTKLHSIQLEFILQYIKFINYYIVKDIFR